MIDKAKAFDYVVNRGYLTGRQIRDALEFGQVVVDRPNLRDTRESILRVLDHERDKRRRDCLLVALDAVDDARGAT